MKTKMLMAGLLALGLCACTSDDNLVADGGDNASSLGENVYMQFTLQMPTRSATTSESTDSYVKTDADEDTEAGSSDENAVNKVLVVLTDDNNEFKAASNTDNNTVHASGSDGYVVTFESSDIAALTSTEVNIWVFCNPTEEVTDMANESDWDMDKAYSMSSVDDNTPWSTSTGFLMSNASVATKTLPASFDAYKNISTPYDMGTIDMERSVARLDFASTKGEDQTEDNTFSIISDDDDDDAGASVTLTDVALVNLSKSFYYLRRVSDDGTSNGQNFAYCGTEWYTAASNGTAATGNYVVDTDANSKSSTYADISSTSFLNALTNFNTSSADWTSLSDITGSDGTEDNWTSTNNTNEYYVWRYVTENTIPGTDASFKGYTTAIVFKGKLNIDEDLQSQIESAEDEDKTIYVYENKLIGTWSMVEASEDDKVKAAVAEVTSLQEETNSATGSAYTEDEAKAEARFTGYKANDDGDYNVYYYYYNRHNDNDNDNSVGIMEFAVVRNNVYKLSVESISKFGHPDESGIDPDPEEPSDPDEEDYTYFKLNVSILPWVVRENSIKL